MVHVVVYKGLYCIWFRVQGLGLGMQGFPKMFPKIRFTFWGAPVIKATVSWDPCWGEL